jgi:hypothetical protein
MKIKEKIMLIAGCSHTAGSEIDGAEDSVYNRQHSYGNQLAYKMEYRPINMAEPGSTNPTIARSVLQWFNEKYDPSTMNVFVLVGWTESSRMEVPWHRPSHYYDHNPYGNYNPTTSKDYLRINLGWAGSDPEEKQLIPEYHRFMATNESYLEIVSANAVLQIQYFLDSLDVDYLMCNTMHMFDPKCKHLRFYKSMINTTKYYMFDNNEEAFFWKYKNAGFENPKAKYWHHNELPHSLYAEELQHFIEANNVYNQMV